ncbi:MAG: hypothetical protein ABI472_24595 [Ginsengibacter sp.]
MKNILLGTCTAIWVFVNGASAQNTTVNGAKQYQTIHGLGVNINPQSWNVNPEAVKKVIDSLVTGLGCTSFRLMFDDCDWEARNDNDDPDAYNWTYYDSIYSAPRFTCVWNTVEYLNSRGITDITLSPDGAAPVWMAGAAKDWMVGTKLNKGSEAEYAEMMSSMVYYGIKRRSPSIHFGMLSPINETTCGGGEGVEMTPNQLGIVFSKIATHLINDTITVVTLIGPDDCGGWPSNVHAMITNSVTMSKLKYFGGHSYGNSTSVSQGLVDSVKNSSYPDRGVIMTEANTPCYGCDGGTYSKDYGFNFYAGPAYKDILQHLNVGVNGIQIWEGYDSRYHHPNRSLTWSMWGIFAVNDTLHPDVYTPRAHYYTFKQLFNFVKPGYQRIDISTTLTNMTVSSFYNPLKGTFVITGKNDSSSARAFDGILKNLPKVSVLKYYYTDASHNFSQGSNITVTNKRFTKLLPAFCVFTLVSE